jgi:sugar O-acyltransferase (sialic acid O-acetyltransferase NeuD family)
MSLEKVAIIGAGGQARETYTVLKKNPNFEFVGFFESVRTKDIFLGYPVKGLEDLDPSFSLHIAIGNEKARRVIVESLPPDTKWATIIDPSAMIGYDVIVGEGSFIAQGCIITENVKLGKHTHLNLHCSISHDTSTGDYLTLAPGARIMGGCSLGENVYMGASSVIRDKVTVCSDVTIGMGAMVVKHIHEAGTYIGIPAKILSKDVH